MNNYIKLGAVVAIAGALVIGLIAYTQNDSKVVKNETQKPTVVSMPKEEKQFKFLAQTVASPIQVVHYLYTGQDQSKEAALNVMLEIRKECKRDCNIFIWTTQEAFNQRAKTSEDLDHPQDFTQPLADLSYMNSFYYMGEEQAITDERLVK